MSRPDSNPGVRFPPPLIFALGLGAGLTLEYFLASLPLLDPTRAWWLDLHAAAFGAVAIWLLGSALGGFKRKGTDPRPWRKDSALVVEGIYRHTRNPMYLGMALAYAAVTLACNSLWPLLTLVPVLLLVRYYVIAREERYLAALFGEAYRDYCRQVRRWF
ncbi:isoprenylcysteine carboxylmethyltransferase family protein [Arenimonas sp.]|uniref:methyltransferase family protein n=1 Tax=Arenimonas sp. TaxID=1872635 RepID=UPI002E357159|nr:isoprenylcysteine carboxylmethyltransferase family protein [Arenimonas sp.]HEX4855057.1 isoprenylcysteine carboxylmethyltransferase family protein [Arenimonas sp.]